MRITALISGLVLLAGCAPPLGSAALPGLAQFDMATVMASDKSLIDHVVSATSGKNCSSVRVEKGLHYCEEDEIQGVKQNIYCYPSLGRVTSYGRSDPYGNNQQKVGENDHNFVKPRPVNAPEPLNRPRDDAVHPLHPHRCPVHPVRFGGSRLFRREGR